MKKRWDEAQHSWSTADIAATDDFTNDYTFDELDRLTRVDQYATGGNAVAEKRVDFAYNALGQFSTISRYANLAEISPALTATYSSRSAVRFLRGWLRASLTRSVRSTIAALLSFGLLPSLGGLYSEAARPRLPNNFPRRRLPRPIAPHPLQKPQKTRQPRPLSLLTRIHEHWYITSGGDEPPSASAAGPPNRAPPVFVH